MSLGPIPPYELPPRPSWPANKVAWTLQPARAALLVHDMQNHFVDPFAGQKPIAAVIASIARLVAAAQAAGVPVVYSAQPGGQPPHERGLLQDFWGTGVPADGRAAGIVDGLAPTATAVHLTKRRYSAFRKTNLADVLQQQQRDQLVVCGVYAHLGCLLTVADAFMQDIQPFLVGDAVADFSRAHHEGALRYVTERCGMVIDVDAAVAGLDVRAARAESAADGFSPAALRRQIADIMGEGESGLADEVSLADWGLDSIRLMTLMERWRQRGVRVSFAELADEPTVAAWSRLLSARHADPASSR